MRQGHDMYNSCTLKNCLRHTFGKCLWHDLQQVLAEDDLEPGSDVPDEDTMRTKLMILYSHQQSGMLYKTCSQHTLMFIWTCCTQIYEIVTGLNQSPIERLPKVDHGSKRRPLPIKKVGRP